MNAQLTIEECFAALDYERKQSEKLEKKLKAALVVNKKNRLDVATLRQRCNVMESKYEKIDTKITYGICDNDEKNIIIDELIYSVKKRKDAIELLDVILQLRNVNKFWQCVKSQPINYIVTILTGMKTRESFDLVLSKIKDK